MSKGDKRERLERAPRQKRGSRLTEHQKRLILAAIEAGATDYVAAEAAGISPRTYRELRQRAKGDHPTRPPTPELRAFLDQIDEATARARMRQEIEIAKSDAKHWLRYRARSKPGLEGWTEPVPDEPEAAEPVHMPTEAELQQVVSALIASGAVPFPHCGDISCMCAFHRAGLLGGGGDD